LGAEKLPESKITKIKLQNGRKKKKKNESAFNEKATQLL